MRIVNPKVRDDLAAGRPIRLNLGVGQRSRPGYYGVDQIELPGVDIVADLNEPLSELPDNSVEAIYTHHTLEHVVEFLPLLKEIHRVVVPGGQVEVVAPHFSNPYAYSDPTHVRFFGLYTFYYFADEADQPRRKVPAFYLPERFAVESVKITLVPTLLLFKPLRRLAVRVFNSSHWFLDWYERSWSRHFPADSIKYSLRVKK
ncbi:MAG TPA: methyltransferase domain-containing protein [Gemmataceae bacterium]|nr:methyltransferase domain-containing protein [Gemmataceae bacterium]